jgi:hypothetical protein
MTRLTAILMATAIVMPAVAGAQIKTLPGDTVTVTATVEAIERSARSITLKGEDGTLNTITVPPEYTRLDTIKVGDKITAKYYENVVLRKKAPGEKDVNTLGGGMTRGSGDKAGGTAAMQRAITATITAIDPTIPSVTLEGPNNWKYSSRIADRDVLKQIAVGDKIDITWTEAVLVSAEAPKK